MKLNCKQGDLAIVVKSMHGNEGKIVRCLELLVTDRVRAEDGELYGYIGGRRAIWRIDRTVNFGSVLCSSDLVQVRYISDANLRPLRGDLTDDEIETTKELETI